MGIDVVMYAEVPKGLASPEQLKLWSWDLAASIGANKFWFWDDRPILYEDEEGPAQASKDSKIIYVSLGGRYYSVGYERGDLLTYCAIAEWLEQNIHGATVWYGGDHGDSYEKFDWQMRSRLKKHLYSTHGRDYFDYPRGQLAPPRCSRCPSGRSPNQFGWGAQYAAFDCPGCGKTQETQDGGATWQAKKVG